MSYINFKYRPNDDIVCEFYAEPAKDMTMKRAAENVAAESSTGTWTEVATSKLYMKKLAAKVFEIKGNKIKVAYPLELFELGSVPQLLSSVAGNIFGMKAVDNLRLEDIQFPKRYVKSFSGPRYGIRGIRKLLKIKKRPLVGTIIKPKLGLKTKDHAESAYNAWRGGCDIVKDDENLTSQNFNRFEDRIIKTLDKLDEAKAETGERKVYMPNVTAETEEMINRADFVKKHGGTYVMVDILTCGWSSLQTLRNSTKLVIHAHRAGHAALTRNRYHGISMLTIAKLCRLIGVDQLHIGTIVGKMEGGKEIIDIENEIAEMNVKEHDKVLKQHWFGMKPVFPVASGGLHPGHVPKLIEYFGKDVIIQMGGGIHGHPKGTFYGAKAARQAIDAAVQGKSLAEYAKTHKELKQAIEKWKADSYKNAYS